MIFVVTENCIKCKYMDCLHVCPVECFYEGENMLAIHPDECIGCGVCEPECDAKAIMRSTEPGAEKWAEVNAKYSEIWPNVVEKPDGYAGDMAYDGEEGKFEKYFSPEPGEGD